MVIIQLIEDVQSHFVQKVLKFEATARFAFHAKMDTLKCMMLKQTVQDLHVYM